MDFPRDSGSLCHDCLHTVFHFPKSQEMKTECNENCGQGATEKEPSCLKNTWLQSKGNGAAHLIPNSIIITGNNTKGVIPVRNICVVSNATSPSIYPIVIKSFQKISEANLLRSNKTEGRIMKLKFFLSWLQ